MTTNNEQRTTDKLTWLFFALLIITIYFFALSVPLLGPDEPRYSQVAREMFERGDFVTPTLGGFDWFEKPALLYWLQIASYHLFGVSEFAARFGSALFGLGTITSLWILGKAVSGIRVQSSGEEIENQVAGDKEQKTTNHKQRTTNNFANWLALIAASSIGVIVFSRGASFDIILTFPMTASLVGFFIFDLMQSRKDPKPQKFFLLPFSFYLSIFYFFIGVALIAKGLVGIVFPLAIVAFYYLLSWKLPSKTFIFSLFWGTMLSLLVACAWYLPMYQINGWKFIDEFFIQHHFQRYTSNKYQHPQPFWFFFLVLPLMTVPWLPFFLASIWKFFRDFFQRQDAKTQGRKGFTFFLLPFTFQSLTLKTPLQIFAIAWMLVPLTFFSLSGSKLPGYILPALPAAIILTGDYVYGFVQKSPKRKYALQISAFLYFVLIAFLLQFVFPRFAYADSVKGLIETADAQGYKTEKVLNFDTLSHNAEFYAAGRLVRTEDGKQKKFYKVAEIVEEMKSRNLEKVLVLAPLKSTKDLTESDLIEAEKLADNTRIAIFLARKTTN